MWSQQVNSTNSLRTALEAARAIGPNQEKIIILDQGHYRFDRELNLDHRDNGLTLKASGNGQVRLYGGRPITGWEKDGAHCYSAALAGIKERQWDFRALVVNGRLAPRARLPRAGRFRHLSEFKVHWLSTTAGGWERKPTAEELTTLKYQPADLGPWLDLNNAELTVYHMWDESMVGIANHDPLTQTLTFSNPAGHPPGAFGVQEYVVWNVREGLTEPGQWYLDRTRGRVVYWPPAGEDLTQVEAIAPGLETIIRIAGSEAQPAANITLQGLTLSATTTPLIAGGFGAGLFDGALSVMSAEDCRFSGLHICQVAGQGIKAAGQRLTFEDCHIHDTGAGGILLNGSDSAIANNHLHQVGAIYPSAIGLWIRKGTGDTISHNEIHDTPYTAIACTGSDNEIEANLIYRAMQQLKDGAGIYITFCKRIIIRGNFIRDIADADGHGSPPSAYYLDEQAEDCLVENNLALNVAIPSHNHMARQNILRHNVFITSGNAKLTFARSADYGLERNIVCAGGRLSITNPEAIVRWNDNILFSGAGTVEGITLKDYDKKPAAPLTPTAGRRIVDPQIIEYQTGKLVFAPASPALKLGIPPLDVSSAGVVKNQEHQKTWKGLTA